MQTKQSEFPDVKQYSEHQMQIQLQTLPVKDKVSVTPQVNSKKQLNPIDQSRHPVHRHSISHLDVAEPQLDLPMYDTQSARIYDDLAVSNLRKAHHIHGIKSLNNSTPVKRANHE